MKHLQLIGLIACASFFASCESTNTTGKGNQEAKRLAALQQQSEQSQLDEGQQNLWNAHESIVNRDGNPIRGH